MTQVRFSLFHGPTTFFIDNASLPVLFPDGGGQPFDTGFIDDIPVHNVQRQGIEHVHYTKAPVAVGKQVTVKVDWDRRW